MTFQEHAIAAVIEAGERLVPSFGKVEWYQSKDHTPWNLVTELDFETEKFIQQKLLEFDPTIGFLGEELGSGSLPYKYWMLDPIDGTTHFIRGMPFCTTMLALIENNQVVFSVIYNFITKELFTAEKGKGAWRNGVRISVSDRPLAQAYLSVEANLEVEEGQSLFLSLRKAASVLAFCCSGYEFGLLASGKIDGRICLNPYGKMWDYAPGSLLVFEAGGVVKNIGSDVYDFKNYNYIAANPIVFEELQSHVIRKI